MLSPYRVLDLCDDRGHFAGFLLAQLGAEVIAVEPPGGQRSRHRGRPFPVSTGVVVAGLLGRTWQLEVEAVAALP